MGIRSAIENDIDKMSQLAHDAYSKYVAAMGRAPPPMLDDFAKKFYCREIFVYEEGDIIGYVTVENKGSEALIENLAVSPKAQGQGIGSALLSYAEKQMHRRKVERLILYTNAKMHKNIPFYQNRGYQIFRHVREEGMERIYFEKFLRSRN